jgi:NADPH:quinone reductase-like Zn-dependent oxidoreductase
MSQLVLSAVDADPARAITLNSAPDLTVDPDSVLVAVEAAPINPTDIAFHGSCFGANPHLRQTLGAEGVGRVLDAGAAVDPVLVGRRVLILPSFVQGTWGDQVVVAARNVVPVSESADALQLAMLPCNAGAAWSLLHDYATVERGEWVGLTLANSGVGQAVIALARRAGIKTLAIVRGDLAALQVRERGAELVIIDGPALGDRILEALGPARLRVLFDGGAQDLHELARAVADGGSIVTYAAVRGRSPELPLADLIRGVSLRGFFVLRWIRMTPREALVGVYAELAELVEAGALNTAVEATYPLERYREAIDHAARAKRSGKVLFTPGKRTPTVTAPSSSAPPWTAGTRSRIRTPRVRGSI